MTKNSKYLIAIIGLVILIIIPPLFRITFPKSKENLANKTLKCSLTPNKDYSITYETTYKNSDVQTIKITYAFNYINGGEDTSSPIYPQILHFSSLKGSTYKYINNDIIITLDQKVYKNNKDDQILKNMYNTYEKVQKYYKKLGYTCK